MRMKSVWGLMMATFLLATLLSCVTSSNVGATGTGFIWITTEGDQQLRAYNINLTNGSIGQVGDSQPTGVQPTAIALTPDGKTLFVVNTSDNNISVYGVNSDGSVTAPSGTTSTLSQGPSGCTTNCTAFGESPIAMAIDPGGKFLFVADQGQPGNIDAPGGISVFMISGTSLTPAGPSCPANFSLTTCPFMVADPVTGFSTGPSALAVSPSSNFLYVANQFSNSVQGYSYDSSGTLRSLQLGGPGSNGMPAGTNPSALVFSRCAGVTQGTASCPAADGDNLFVANSGSNNVSIFAACIQASTTCAAQGAAPDGTLVQVAASPVAAGLSPGALFVNPVLNFVYAVNRRGNNVTQYRYSSSTGALTTLSPAAVNAGNSPFGGGITSDGAYVLVSNNNGSSMSIYSVAAGGKLAPATAPTLALPGQPSAILVR